MDIRIAYDRYYAELGRKTEALYLSLREAIVGGQLAERTRLPSSRELAGLYGLSRGAVNEAYDMLLAEGFVRTRSGSGTYVAFRGAAEHERAARGDASAAAQIPLSGWAQRLEPARISRAGSASDKGRRPSGEGAIDFGIGQIDAGLFPVEEWKSSLHAEIRGMTAEWPGPAAEPEGYPPLREAIARELRLERGIRAEPEQLFLTSGSMQAIALLAMLLVGPGKAAVLENPGYAGTRRAVRAAGGSLIAAPVDEEGIVPADWPAELLFVTPTRHFPTGIVLSPSRRMELLDWASRRGAVIVEDDYDSELRWGGRPAEPMKALDREERVVYVGTFSKTMYPDLRIGYTVLPHSLIEPFRRAKALFDPRPPGLAEQRALAHFMASGSYARHLRRMRRYCGRRLIRLQEELGARLERWFRPVPTDAGLHLYARWRGEPDEYDRYRAACEQAGVRWDADDGHWMDERKGRAALFGFAHLPEELLSLGAERMEAVAKRLF